MMSEFDMDNYSKSMNTIVSKKLYFYLPPAPFDQESLLRKMYLEGNQCLAPGMFIRSDVLGLVGDFHPLLRMTQDYEYHIRVLSPTKPDFNPLPLTQYRRMSDNSNLSSTNRDSTVNSEYNEAFFVLRNYQRFIQSYSHLLQFFLKLPRWTRRR